MYVCVCFIFLHAYKLMNIIFWRCCLYYFLQLCGLIHHVQVAQGTPLACSLVLCCTDIAFFIHLQFLLVAPHIFSSVLSRVYGPPVFPVHFICMMIILFYASRQLDFNRFHKKRVWQGFATQRWQPLQNSNSKSLYCYKKYQTTYNNKMYYITLYSNSFNIDQQNNMQFI